MKTEKRVLGTFLLTMVYLTGSMAFSAAAEESASDICGVCGMPFNENGFCVQDFLNEDGLGLQRAELETDPENSERAYRIDNVGELAWFIREMRNGTLEETQNAYLTDDMDWSLIAPLEWEQIGTWQEESACLVYQGIFDGNGHTISNVSFEDRQDGTIPALFGTIGESGEVRELGLTNVNITSRSSYAAVLTGRNKGTIRDCYTVDSMVAVFVNGAMAGDITAANDGAIQNCFTDAKFAAGVTEEGTNAVFQAIPVTGENSRGADVVFNNYYLLQESGMEVPAAELASAVTENELADGSVAWRLNNGCSPAVYGQKLLTLEEQAAGQPATKPELISTDIRTDETGNEIQVRNGYPVYRVVLDYASEETADSVMYTNGTVLFSELPAVPEGGSWQFEQDGGMVDAAGDLQITSDLVLTERTAAAKQEIILSVVPNSTPILYDGTAVGPEDFSVSGNQGGAEIYLTFYAADGATQIEAPSEPGTYFVVASVGETDVWQGAVSAPAAFSIEQPVCQHLNQYAVEETAATCTTPGVRVTYCSDCSQELGREEIPVLQHSFINYVETTPATCMSNAVETASCEYGCGTTDEREVENSKTEHKFGEYTITKEATCMSNAVETASCEYGCGTTDEREVENSKAEHKFGEYTITKEATCMSNAVETASCEYGCGTTDEREVENSKIEHKFGEYTITKEATCMSNAVETASCEYGCGTTDEREVENSRIAHRFGEYTITKEATCMSNAVETASCEYGCGTTDEREVENSKTEHKFGEYTITKEATCMSNAVETASCEYGCGTTDEREVENSKAEHKFGEYTITKEATCMSNAVETASCEYGCGTTDEREVENSKTEHNYADGVCAVCGAKDESYIESTVTASISDDNLGANDWYCGPVTLLAPEGYTISLTADGEFKSSATAEITDGTNTINYYLRKGNGSPAARSITVKADVQSPTIALKIGNMTARERRSDIDFGTFFTAYQTAAIEAEDNMSGVMSIEYVITNDSMNDAERDQAEWLTYEAGSVIKLNQEGRYIIYARATDNAGNIAYANTNGFIIDVTAPKAEGITAGGACCPGKEISVSDANGIASVTLNNVKTELSDGKLILTSAGTQTLVIIDNAGNQTSISFTVNQDHVWDTGTISEEATCMKEGTKTYTCVVCGKTKTEIVPKAAHRFAEYKYNQDATCEKNGTKTAICEYGCGTEDTVEAPGTQLAHTYGTDGVCIRCHAVNPNYTAPTTAAPTTAPTTTAPTTAAPTTAITTAPTTAAPTTAAGSVTQVLGIEDYSGWWGILLVAAGVLILLAAAAFAIERKKR